MCRQTAARIFPNTPSITFVPSPTLDTKVFHFCYSMFYSKKNSLASMFEIIK